VERRRNENGGSLRVERVSQGEAKESKTRPGEGESLVVVEKEKSIRVEKIETKH